ncbi:uncharacterized protein [Palaemon carinicauda]|uniref:uncharacterized protein n=1 Tax=Palaemon carinicauda TaxID=392227 RepID=UPI0035B68CD6
MHEKGGGARLNVMLNRELLDEVDQYKWLRTVFDTNSGVEADVHQRVIEKCKVMRAMKWLVMNIGLGMNEKRVLYGKVIVPIMIRGSELCGMKLTERQTLNVFEIKCLRGMAGVSGLDKVRNELVMVTTGVRNDLAARVDINVLR